MSQENLVQVHIMKARNLIAAREFNTAEANYETARYGEWRCDHRGLDEELAREIDMHLTNAHDLALCPAVVYAVSRAKPGKDKT